MSPRQEEAGGPERFLPFWWDMRKLHSLQVPARTLPLDELRWQLSGKVWSNYGAPFRVSPAEVRRDPDRFTIHYERAMAADLSFPLYVVRWGDRWTILDGMHRLLKAEILGMEELPVYVIGPEEVSAIMVPPPEEAMTILREFFEENPLISAESSAASPDAGPEGAASGAVSDSIESRRSGSRPT